MWDLFPTVILTKEVVKQNHTLIYAPNFGFLFLTKRSIAVDTERKLNVHKMSVLNVHKVSVQDLF